MPDEAIDFNTQIIEGFRADHGVVGGPFEGKNLVLLHHVGRRTGRERVSPLVAARDGEAYLVCGSAGGADHDPAWVANIEHGSGRTVIETGDATLPVRTTVVHGDDPDWPRVYGLWAAYWPAAAEYETHTSRRFPIIRLEPLPEE